MRRLLLLFFVVLAYVGVRGQATDLFISEYIEGSSSNKAIEIYNGTGADVDLTGYSVKQANNGNGWGSTSSGADDRYVLPLSGTLADGEVYVIYNDAAVADISSVGDVGLAYSSTVNTPVGANVAAFNADDAMGLFKNDVLIDVIGIPAEDPGSAWDVAGVTAGTKDHTMVRKASISVGSTNWATSAGTNAEDSEWIVYDQDEFSYIGSHTMSGSGPSTAANIISFTVESQQGETIIDAVNQMINFDMVVGTDLAALAPSITVSEGALINPLAGVAQNFNDTVVYTVTAEDETTQKIWKAVAHLVAKDTVLFSDDFEDATLDKWINHTAVGDTLWINTSGGHNDSKCAFMNGYIGGYTANENWLIADSIDLSVVANKNLSFFTATKYSGPELVVKYSLDYANDADPSTATWTDLSGVQLATGTTWTNSGEIDLSSFDSENFSIAFVYSSNTTSAARWMIDDVLVKGSNELSTDAEILALSFETEESTTIISDSAKIRSVLTWDTDVTALMPTISVSAGAQVSPTTMQNFSDSVVYTVIAQDGVTKKDWTVYVALSEAPVVASIYDIQYTTDGTGDSPLINKFVQTAGIVTGIGKYGFYIQDSAKIWNGLYVYSSESGVEIGDSVVVEGTVSEYYNLTELGDCKVKIIESGKQLPLPVVVELANLGEAYECVYSKVLDVVCVAGLDSYEEWDAKDADGNSLAVGDELYKFIPVVGHLYKSITGVMTYTFSEFKMLPRSDEDMVRAIRTENDIISFTLREQYSDAVINADNHTVNIEVVEGTDITSLTPTIDVSPGAQVTPTTTDFSSPVSYIVEAEDGTTQEWVATVSIHVGVQDNFLANVKLFPNPFNDRITFTNLQNISKIVVNNIVGQKLMEVDVIGTNLVLETDNLRNGIYLITIIDNQNSMRTERMTK